MMPMRRCVPQRVLRVVLPMIMLMAGVGLAGCTSPKNALGTNSSPCFRSLAVAEDAVHSHGRFSGVRDVNSVDLIVDLVEHRHGMDVPPSLAEVNEEVCVVAYVGRFTTASVKKGWSLDTGVGHFVLVVVVQKTNQLLGSIVLPTTPLRLARIFPSLN